MFSEWRKRSNLMWVICTKLDPAWKDNNVTASFAYRATRAAFKAGVRAGIKQEQARRK